MHTLRLGRYDQSISPPNPNHFLKPYHSSMSPLLKDRHQFRDERFSRWRDFFRLPFDEIRLLQKSLKRFGFFPNSVEDGIFGYGTLAAVRLFQEYVRTVEGNAGIGIPDGVVGHNTRTHIQRWDDQQQMANWVSHSHNIPSAQDWLTMLSKIQAFYLSTMPRDIQLVEEFIGSTSTRKVAQWDLSNTTIHLIGIRRNETSTVFDRPNDDLFILLLNDMVWKAYGSTDPNPRLTSRPDEAYLIRGQHDYTFGWHKKNKRDRVYKCMVPRSPGVLVLRDLNNDDALTLLDFPPRLGSANPTINIHWSGDGRLNYSAGCQVIAGKAYLSPADRRISCETFAAKKYQELGGSKTKGAYNFFSDLITCYGSITRPSLTYTLIHESDVAAVTSPITSQYLDILRNAINS